MIEITVKTLDSKNHNFSVADDMTVRQLKEHIVDSVNIPAESQRLIYCGRVLQDEKNLSEYDVNGKVVHLVQRAPPDNNARGQYFFPGSSTDTSGSQGTPRHTIFGPAGHAGNAMYVGAMAFPAEIMDASGISMQQPRQCLSRSRLSLVRTLLRRANFNLSVLERPIQDHPEIPPQIGSQTQDALTDEDGNSDSGIEATIEISPGSFIIDNQQIDVGGPSVEIQTESVPEQSTSAPEAESDPQSATTSDQQPPRNNYQEARNRSRYPRTRALADLLDQVRSINTRVQPYMTRFLQLMRDDPACPDQRAVLTNQTLFTGVSELMHNLAHAYHALSDIMCDFSQQPPRFLTCRPVLIHHSAVVQTGIPIQVSSSTSAGSSSQPSSNGNSARSAPSTATGCKEPPTTQASDAPQTSATSQPSSSSQTSASSQPPSEEATPSGETTPSGDATPSTQPSASNATNPDDPADRQPRSPSTSPPRVARIGGSGVPGFEIFVDVAPGSITIDSLEATVVGNAPPNTAEPNTWQNPPEFLQNFVSALAGQFMGATLQQYRFPEQQSTGTNTQQTTAASTQSAAGVSQPSQNSQARSNTATHPTTATQTRSTARPHVHLSPSIHGLRTNTSYDPFLPCNSHHIRYCRNSHHRAPQGQANSGTNTTPEGPRVVPMPAPSSISISLRADPVINREQRPSRSTGIQPVQNIFASLPQELQMLFQTIRAPNALYGGQTPTTLAQLLQDVPGYSFTLGESIFTDIFMTLAQSLTFMDMVQLGLGSSECLIRARPQLQQMVSERLLNGEPLTISGITNIIDRFNDELRPYFNLFDNARLREEVDLPASVNLYNHTMIPIILNTLMEEQDQSTFHRTLLRKCALYVHQLCALVQYCCLDGVTGLERILGTFVSQMTTGLPSVLQEWTLSHSVINFRTFIGSLNVPIDDIKRYLVYRIGNDPTATSSQPAATQPQPPPVTEPMETDDSDVEIVEPPTLPPNEPSSTDDPPLDSINEEEIAWRNTLPSDWVPIISRDSQRQRRQSPQGPFSDAYLSGMPSKRRKLITSAKPQGNLSQVISESMATALGAAGMSSGPEVEVIAQRAGQDSSLRTAYREQVRTTLHHKLSNNTDFTPDKYPNTAKYFKKP